MYTFPDPPYFLLLVGLFVSLTSGVAFEAVLKQSVRAWSKTGSSQSLANLQGTQLSLPFLGIALGVCLFLASGIQIFGFPRNLAYLMAVPLTAFTSWLVWTQLGKILVQLQQGGSKALDLDSFV